jgi:CRISPR-associated protein Csh1
VQFRRRIAYWDVQNSYLKKLISGMIKELINFTDSLEEEFKNLGSLPKEGLHVLIKSIVNEEGEVNIDLENFKHEQFSKKQKDEPSEFLNYCKLLHENAWMVDTNKCFDTTTRAIHSCSPFCIAIKRDNLEGGKNYEARKKEGKNLVYESFDTYFNKAFALFENEEEKEKYILFKHFFTHNHFSKILAKIEDKQSGIRQHLEEKNEQLKNEFKESKDKGQKEALKEKIAQTEQELLKVKPLEDSSYIIFYFDVPLELYKNVHKKYLDDKLFNTDKYNTTPDADGLIFGTNNFLNGFNSNMPFLIHQTASFDISGRISNVEAKLLNDLKNMFPNKTLPTPLPVFIYKDEILQDKVIGIFRESGFKFGYKEIIQKLVEDNEEDISNYYLLFWQNTMDGIVFRDFDFVSRFEYKFKDPLIIQNLFDIKEKGGKENKHYQLIKNIFDFEQQVLKPLIQSKYLRVDYFGDLNKEDYAKLDRTFSSYSKYRKAVYDFVYKSQRNSISWNIFEEMSKNRMWDFLKIAMTSTDKNENKNAVYGIKETFNIWYSLYDFFNKTNKLNTMANNLKNYQDFVAKVAIKEADTDNSSDKETAFAAGQIIEYLINKSEASNKTYQLLEPYLQASDCLQFKKAINDGVKRYQHAIKPTEQRFKNVLAFVNSWETSKNLHDLQPEIIAGVFSENQFFKLEKSK